MGRHLGIQNGWSEGRPKGSQRSFKNWRRPAGGQNIWSNWVPVLVPKRGALRGALWAPYGRLKIKVKALRPPPLRTAWSAGVGVTPLLLDLFLSCCSLRTKYFQNPFSSKRGQTGLCTYGKYPLRLRRTPLWIEKNIAPTFPSNPGDVYDYGCPIGDHALHFSKVPLWRP